MSFDDASDGAARDSDLGTPEVETPAFSGEERPVVRRVFKKFCDMRDTLEEIEGWIDERGEREASLLLPPGNQFVLTPEALDLYMTAEQWSVEGFTPLSAPRTRNP